MYLQHLLLRNFRNITQLEIFFSPHINAIHGQNAQGKSSILEAIYLLSTGRSFRTNKTEELIQQGKEFFFIEATFIKDEINHTLKIYYDGRQKKYHLDEDLYPSFTPLLGFFPSILHSPEDIDLITGPPQLRRRALNIHLAQKDPTYAYHLMRYSKALKQRNALFKNKSYQAIECWEEEMALSGSFLSHARKEVLSQLKEPLHYYYQKISPLQEVPSFSYQSSIPVENQPDISKKLFQNLLQKNRDKEKEIKHTLVGPHRDDFSILLNDLACKSYASEGQKQSLVTAFRLAEWSLFPNKCALAIDDFGSQLDQERKDRLNKLLHGSFQVFLTSPERVSIQGSTIKYFTIENGKISA